MGKMPGKPTKVTKAPMNMLADAPAPGSSVIPQKRGKKSKASSNAKVSTMKMKKPKVNSTLTLFKQDKDQDGQ